MSLYLRLAHCISTREKVITQRLATATRRLSIATRRLSTVTRCLSIATRRLSIAMDPLPIATHWLYQLHINALLPQPNKTKHYYYIFATDNILYSFQIIGAIAHATMIVPKRYLNICFWNSEANVLELKASFVGITCIVMYLVDLILQPYKVVLLSLKCVKHLLLVSCRIIWVFIRKLISLFNKVHKYVFVSEFQTHR